MKSGSTLINFEELAQAVEGMREVMQVFVAGLVADGFTDKEARSIIAGLFAARAEAEGNDG